MMSVPVDWLKGDRLFQYVWMLPVIFATGCASMQDMFCNLVDPDSYVLVSVAGCQTMQVSFDYGADADFSLLESYAWMPAEHTGSGDLEIQHDSQSHEWVTDSVDAKLSEKGFRLDRTAPDFLVSYDVPVEMRGTLTLIFVHARSRQLIWRGTVDDEAYPARNPDVWEIRIRTAVDMLLKQFPPPIMPELAALYHDATTNVILRAASARESATLARRVCVRKRTFHPPYNITPLG
jgi:hypothetical protein